MHVQKSGSGRHTHITKLLRGGASLTEARELARHRDIRMTMRYTHIGIMDRDTKFCRSFRMMLEREGLHSVQLPPRSPNLSFRTKLAEPTDSRRRAFLKDGQVASPYQKLKWRRRGSNPQVRHRNLFPANNLRIHRRRWQRYGSGTMAQTVMN